MSKGSSYHLSLYVFGIYPVIVSIILYEFITQDISILLVQV